MAKFVDSKGREWPVIITVLTLKKFKAAGVALNFSEAFADPLQFFQLLWITVQSQAAGFGVTEDEFAELLDGATVEAAAAALMEAHISFTLPSSATQANDKFRQMLATARGELHRKITTFSNPATELPGV